MQGSTLQRVGRLLSGLLAQPRYVPRYIRDNLLRRATPMELALPWIAYGAVEFLASYLKPSHRVFEWGSGGSTLFFASSVAQVTSVEHDAAWWHAVRAGLDRRGARNVELELHPLEGIDADVFCESRYVKRCAGRYDVILVDGFDGFVGAPQRLRFRQQCFAHAQSHVERGGIIVVDDFWMYREVLGFSVAQRHELFQSPGPGRLGVTTTAVFFY